MRCDTDQLAARALGLLDEAAAKAVEAHAAGCPRCAHELARLREMATALRSMPEAENEPMDVEALWSAVAARKAAAGRRAWTWERIVPRRGWAVALATAACVAVLSFHYGVSVQVGQVRIGIGGPQGAGPVAQGVPPGTEELIRHLARYDEAATRVERTLIGIAHAVNDLDARHRRELAGLRNELAMQRASDQTEIRKSFDLVANEMTDALRRRQ